MSEIYQGMAVVLGGYLLATFLQKVVYPHTLKPGQDFKKAFGVGPFNKNYSVDSAVETTLQRLRVWESYLKQKINETTFEVRLESKGPKTQVRVTRAYIIQERLGDVSRDASSERASLVSLALRFGFGITREDGSNPIADAGYSREITSQQRELWKERRPRPSAVLV
ncbi:MAG: hypothetical protein A3J50_00580 [Candidatus Woykebacteria bacterium RIFCSPHIGHO2_02_FULL_43_16b]|uniref:Uncharacterized protein n=1 Tax=Candidatus Woykebacteria bacterium RIFCSPHIGHO2_02_FULL_43_16b TaxID=1802601 RepID=A0A1G1WP94_9BACT|nr:MAG: hypothetical protein A3J50_00580 [Candidatus Woykebacteria bacterium RIFCSPHIGHO2_02_FULL_43_16b]